MKSMTMEIVALLASGCGELDSTIIYNHTVEFQTILPLPLEKVTTETCKPLYFADADLSDHNKSRIKNNLLYAIKNEEDLFAKQHYLAVIAKCDELKWGDAP